MWVHHSHTFVQQHCCNAHTSAVRTRPPPLLACPQDFPFDRHVVEIYFDYGWDDPYLTVSNCSEIFRVSGLRDRSRLQNHLPTSDEWRLYEHERAHEGSIRAERYPYDNDETLIELFLSENETDASTTIPGGRCKIEIVLVRNYFVFVFKWLGLSLLTVVGCLLTLLMDPKDHISDRYSSMIVGILIMVRHARHMRHMCYTRHIRHMHHTRCIRDMRHLHNSSILVGVILIMVRYMRDVVACR